MSDSSVIEIAIADVATVRVPLLSEFRRLVVADQAPCDWIEVAIIVGDTYVYGEQRRGVTGLACSFVLQLLESVDAAIMEDRYITEFEYGPAWMVIEPLDETTVTVSRCTTMMGARNLDKRLGIDISRDITKCGWIETIIEAAHDFRDVVLDLNSDLRETTALE